MKLKKTTAERKWMPNKERDRIDNLKGKQQTLEDFEKKDEN